MQASWQRQGVVMLAIDTNLIVRYLTGDHPQQSRKAKSLIDSESVFVSKTVLLETEWVPRGVFKFTPGVIVQALTDFAGLPSVTLEDAATIAKALNWMAGGMDFADALHLASAQESDAFVTFDRDLAKKAKKLSDIAVRVL
jgi:predicted nucleic acid-binding protein